MFDCDLNAEDMAEIEKEVRENYKLTIRALEIFYEELEKSNLPDNVKMAIMLSSVNKK